MSRRKAPDALAKQLADAPAPDAPRTLHAAGIPPFKPFRLEIADPALLSYLAWKSERHALRNKGEALTPERAALAALRTAMGRDAALNKYSVTGGAFAPAGTRIPYASLDATVRPEREALKDAAILGMSILPDLAGL